MEQLINWDVSVFNLINQQWVNPMFDAFLPVVRNKYFWSPLYLFIIVFLIQNFKWKGLWIVVFVLAAFAISDSLSSHIIKPWIGRLRPCNDPSLIDQVRLLVGCGSGFSFTSSHATNHFAIAFFFISLFIYRFKWLIPVAIFWAGMVSYAQIYVGVHFPIDIICGTLLGSVIGIWMGTFARIQTKIPELQSNQI
jgi:membrane-associated phospholipid phosphatase